MKTCIYVFSGTGTSLAVATKIADSLDNTEIKLIPTVLKNVGDSEIKVEAQVVGFVFPNYFGRTPEIVSRFIRNLNLDSANYIFSIVTSGGGPGKSLKFIEQELISKGKKLNYGESIVGISNYIVGWYYKLISPTGKKRENTLRKIDQKAEHFANDISSRKNKIAKSGFQPSLLISPNELVDTRQWDKEFSIHESCTGCRICEKLCQANNIKMNNNKPEFQHNCQRCLACVHYCPHHAIGYKGKPLRKPRYFHPDYPAKEIIDFINRS